MHQTHLTLRAEERSFYGASMLFLIFHYKHTALTSISMSRNVHRHVVLHYIDLFCLASVPCQLQTFCIFCFILNKSKISVVFYITNYGIVCSFLSLFMEKLNCCLQSLFHCISYYHFCIVQVLHNIT